MLVAVAHEDYRPLSEYLFEFKQWGELLGDSDICEICHLDKERCGDIAQSMRRCLKGTFLHVRQRDSTARAAKLNLDISLEPVPRGGDDAGRLHSVCDPASRGRAGYVTKFDFGSHATVGSIPLKQSQLQTGGR